MQTSRAAVLERSKMPLLNPALVPKPLLEQLDGTLVARLSCREAGNGSCSFAYQVAMEVGNLSVVVRVGFVWTAPLNCSQNDVH